MLFMKKILVLFVILISCISLFAQTQSVNKPKLVVLITIDGLKSEHLSIMYDRLCSGGFKHILNHGTYVQNVEFNYVAKSSVSDVASICTATTPANNGIVGNKIFSDLSNNFVSIVDDKEYHGIYSSVGRSPKNLVATTFADNLKITSPQSKVFSIALTAEKAIVMGGHNANGVVWIDKEANISSTDYYRWMPSWATAFNEAGIVKNSLRSPWQPMYSLYTYTNKPFYELNGNFYVPAVVQKGGQDMVKNFIYTASANTIICELAQKAIVQEKLGQDNATDVLCLNFNVNTSFNNTAELNTAEKEDLYLSLDDDIKDLLQLINEKIKISNTLVVVAGTQTEPFSQKTLRDNRLPVGKFDGKRAVALLNSYLMAKYGQARWVLNYADGNLFLNNTEIEKKNIDREKMGREIVNFISNIKGVTFSATYDDIRRANGDIKDPEVRLKNSLFRGRSGDIIVVLNAGWTDTDTNGNESYIASTSLQYTPLFFYGVNIENDNIDLRYAITDIAPTICKILQIPYPNASMGNAIKLKTKK